MALCVCRISRLNPFTCVIGERYLSPGSSRFVASPPAGFCSDLVVSLSSGWILPTRLCQLSWRTSSRAAPTTRAGRPPHRTVRAALPHTALQQDDLHFCYRAQVPFPHLPVITADNRCVPPWLIRPAANPFERFLFQPYESLLRLTLVWASPTPQTIPLSFVSLDLSKVPFQVWGLPSSDTNFSVRPSMVSDPGRLLCAHPIVHNIIGFQLQDSLALCVCCISRLNPFTCVIDERYLSPGSSRFVTSPPAGFCSDLVVSLLSGWILPTRLCQLSWRTL